MIDDLETFIAEQKARLSQEKQELKQEQSHSQNGPPASVPSVGDHEQQRRRRTAGQTHKDYQQFMLQEMNRDILMRKPSTPEEGLAMKLGGYADRRHRLMEEKRNDYNSYLAELNLHQNFRPQQQPQGHESPILSYAEILQKKKNEENVYRRSNDPRYFDHRMDLGGPGYNRMSASEGNLNSNNSEKNLRGREADVEPKKVKFASNPAIYHDQSPRMERRHHVNPDNTQFNATLLIGERQPIDRQKKEAYRQELLQQMAETQMQRDKDKQRNRGLLPDDSLAGRAEGRPTSWPTESVAPDYLSNVGQAPRIPQNVPVDFGRAKPQFDQNRNFYKLDGILTNGFEFDRMQPRLPRPLSVPSAQPQAVPSLFPENGQISDAYFYYGMQNPLDPALMAGQRSTIPMVPSGVPVAQPMPRPGAYAMPPPDSFRSSYSGTAMENRASVGMPGISDDKDQRKREEKKRQYQLELQEQMAESKLRKQKELEEKEKYDKKLADEIANYNPFGRGGGGAPVKDMYGNAITSRNLGSLVSHQPRSVGFVETQRTPRSDIGRSHSDLPILPPLGQPDKPGDSFARGGHGIFGEPMTQEQKNSRLKYQDELRQQMEEKRLRLEKEREQMRKEDEVFEKRLREDAAKAAQELEEAQKKEREKQEKLKQDQLGLKMKAEEKRLQEEQQKKEAEETERKKQEQEHKRQDVSTERLWSPPINSMLISRHKENINHNQRPSSPPIPTRRLHSRQSQISNMEALEHLANFGRKLQLERENIETDFKRLKSEPDVYDPRLILRPHNSKHSYPNIFDLAKTGRPASVRRLPTRDPGYIKPRNNSLLNRNYIFLDPLSDSNFDESDLERRQRDVLREQSRELDELKESYVKENEDPRHQDRLDSPELGLLHSTSDYLAFPTYESLNKEPRRNNRAPRAAGTRRQVSIDSLDPNELSRLNQERSQKIRSLAGDDLYSGNSEEMLNRFVRRQTHRRPPSDDTLNDQSWLFPA